jgi:hypothetical protein
MKKFFLIVEHRFMWHDNNFHDFYLRQTNGGIDDCSVVPDFECQFFTQEDAESHLQKCISEVSPLSSRLTESWWELKVGYCINR